LSRLLCPQVHQNAEHFEERYRRLWRALDDGRTWLGTTHPEPASFAQRLIDEDHYYWTSRQPLRCPAWTWQAPRYVTGISAYRNWLDTKPFAKRESSNV
jgi:hypothetical protein